MLAARVPVIAISAHHASTAEETPVAAVNHHGVDVESFPAGDGGGGYALFLGRMNPDKGVDTAIQVARAAGMPLKIAAKMAEPAEQEYFRLEVQPLLDADVEFVGQVGGEDKMSLIAGATCLLNPLRWAEPFGMVMIEALACGTPVVARPLGSVPEIIDHGVTGFAGLTDAELVDGVRRAGALDREVCRAVARERFSTARMVADHVAFYRSVLARPGPGATVPGRGRATG
jgi:glycosyltransferase involved in cell wall biosynthesis